MVGAWAGMPTVGTRLADGGQAGADRQLAGDEVGTAGRAARLGVVVGEEHALGGQPVEVRRPPGHDAAVVGADVEPADVVAHDEHDVRLLARRGLPGPGPRPGLWPGLPWQVISPCSSPRNNWLAGLPARRGLPARFAAGRSVECEMTRRGDITENCAYSDEQQCGNPVSIHAENSRAKLRNRSWWSAMSIFVTSSVPRIAGQALEF